MEAVDATETKLLSAMKAGGIPKLEDFRDLVKQLEHHHILARVFLLDGTPHVFVNSPMKYIIFKEQVAAEFDLGSAHKKLRGERVEPVDDEEYVSPAKETEPKGSTPPLDGSAEHEVHLTDAGNGGASARATTGGVNA